MIRFFNKDDTRTVASEFAIIINISGKKEHAFSVLEKSQDLNWNCPFQFHDQLMFELTITKVLLFKFAQKKSFGF